MSGRVKPTASLLLILPVVLLAGVAVNIRIKEAAHEQLSQAIVGKWRHNNGTVLDVQKDDTYPGKYNVKNISQRITLRHTYTFVDTDHVRIEGDTMPHTPVYTTKVQISGDKLIFDSESRGPNAIPAQTFERIE